MAGHRQWQKARKSCGRTFRPGSEAPRKPLPLKVPRELVAGATQAVKTEVFSSSFSYGFENFSQKMNAQPSDRFINSKNFFSGDRSWSLRVYPNRYISSASTRNVGLFLHTSNLTYQTKVKFRLYVVENNGSQENEQMIYKDFVENHTLTNDAGGSSCIGGSWDFVNREQLISCAFTRLPNNVLTIGCELSWCYDIGQDNFDFESPTTFSFQSKPSGLLTFFNDPIYNQFIIEIGEKTLYASKLLLAQKNSVFRALFANSGFLDSQQKNSIRIDDVDPEAFEGVLKYWYTEAIPNIEPSQAKEWLKICDRYDISSLKALLEKGFVTMLNPGNAVELLLAADNTSFVSLRENALHYIKTKWKKVVETKCLDRLQVSPSLLDEMEPAKRPRLS